MGRHRFRQAIRQQPLFQTAQKQRRVKVTHNIIEVLTSGGLALCFRPERISLGYCHIPLAHRICGQPHIQFYCGRVCYHVRMPMK